MRAIGMRKNKILSLVLTIMLVLGVLPSSVLEVRAEELQSGDFTYTVADDKATIKKYTGSDSVVEIPDTLGGKSVVAIGKNAFWFNSSLTSITIPNSVTDIGDSAFYACEALESVTVPDSVTDIGDSAFQFCRALESVTIPNSVMAIGDSAFGYCEALKSVTIPNSVTAIGDSAFLSCEALESVTIPNSVTDIGESVFQSCIALKSVTMPNSVTGIGDFAFRNCMALKSVTIPNSVTSIGEYAFFWCTGLESVTIPNSVTDIGEYAFGHCKALESIAIPNSVTNIEYGVFYNCTALKNVTIPKSVTDIGGSAFNGCIALKSVTIPISVTAIGDSAFKSTSDLTDIYLPNHGYNNNGGVITNSDSWGIDASKIHWMKNPWNPEDFVINPASAAYTGKAITPPSVTVKDTVLSEIVVPPVYSVEYYDADGEKVEELSEIGTYDVRVVIPKRTGVAEIVNVEVDAGTFAIKAELTVETTGDASAIVDKEVGEQLIELFTKEEITQNKEKKVTVNVDVVVSEDMDPTAQSQFDTCLDGINKELDENMTAKQAVVFDISVIKSLDGVDENITELKTPIKIVIPIPEEYQSADRVFFILRNHNGTITKLEDLDSDNTTITIETDCFSNYTLNYIEKPEIEKPEIEKPEIEEPSTDGSQNAGNQDTVPNTGDNSGAQLVLFLMIASLLGVAVVSRKKYMK